VAVKMNKRRRGHSGSFLAVDNFAEQLATEDTEITEESFQDETDTSLCALCDLCGKTMVSADGHSTTSCGAQKVVA